jgi:hypothetical protein
MSGWEALAGRASESDWNQEARPIDNHSAQKDWREAKKFDSAEYTQQQPGVSRRGLRASTFSFQFQILDEDNHHKVPDNNLYDIFNNELLAVINSSVGCCNNHTRGFIQRSTQRKDLFSNQARFIHQTIEHIYFFSSTCWDC